ncbi:MAG: hypothetical protein SFZ03_04885 [Candidatus Melainabacteria bacterium]|nr:hypothetical protein [Candidatus Melainabacteria bacterium]
MMTPFLPQIENVLPVYKGLRFYDGTAFGGRARQRNFSARCAVPVALSLLLLSCMGGLLAGPVFAQNSHTPLTVNSATQQVPAGTILRITFNSEMDSRITQPGEPFTAIVSEDFVMNGNHIVLPAGTVVRGRVQSVSRPRLFSKGGAITLNFDHVVAASGEAIPLDFNLSTQNANVNSQGALYTDPGIGKKVQKGVDDGKETFNKLKDAGIDAGKDLGGGAALLVTVPTAVVGGAVAGSAVTAGKAVQAVVGRGESVVIKPGDQALIDFGGTFNLPAAQ